jgi:hypothetical protein
VRLPFFYGWVVVAIAFATMAMGVNARTAFSLFFPPILAEFGWDRGLTAGAFSFGFLASMTSYALAFWIAIGCSIVSIGAMWLVAPRKVRAVAGRIGR